MLRQPTAADFEAWRNLYRQYCEFYQVSFSDELANTVWGWLHDTDHVLEGLVAVRDGQVVGLAHFREVPEPLAGAHGGFLDDLFVDPAMRGQGIGRALIADVVNTAKSRNWVGVQWLTGDDNYPARRLYDQVAIRTMWLTYEAKTTR
ncbi:MAG: GNAT family N-acetyltransferase [Actinomycetia bacterium]|nr:GNAT family N-acetyltransferase [Actinomycetes bacterium]MCH9801844.1 GNAT family N-acetyltransferase [Actinomycetes bacterium]